MKPPLIADKSADVLVFFNLVQAMLGRRDRKWAILTHSPWSEILMRARAIFDCYPSTPIESILIAHFEESGRPLVHPLHGWAAIDKHSLYYASKLWHKESGPASEMTEQAKFELVFNAIHLTGGTPMVSSFEWLKDTYAKLGLISAELTKQNREIIERLGELPETILDRILP